MLKQTNFLQKGSQSLLLTTSIQKLLVDGSQWASWQGYHIPVSDEYFVVWTPAGTLPDGQISQWLL